MKAALGMPKNLTGVLITKAEPLAHASKVRERQGRDSAGTCCSRPTDGLTGCVLLAAFRPLNW